MQYSFRNRRKNTLLNLGMNKSNVESRQRTHKKEIVDFAYFNLKKRQLGYSGHAVPYVGGALCRTITVGLTQLVTEMSARNLSGG
jgi:hypothetical protein